MWSSQSSRMSSRGMGGLRLVSVLDFRFWNLDWEARPRGPSHPQNPKSAIQNPKSLGFRRRDLRPDGFAPDDAGDVTGDLQVEDDQRDPPLHAERDRGQIHHP